MKLYAIRNWNKTYENNRSRTVQDLTWVPIRNRHDGETYTMLISQADAAIIFSAFVLLVQVASRCQPRGTLMRGNGIPHDPASLAAKTRAPRQWFETALPYLERHTDWLEVTEFKTDRQEPVTPPSPPCHPPVEEQKGMEQNGNSPPPPPEFAERPNESEVKFYAGAIGLAEWKALDWLDEMRGGGWLDYQHRPIGDWRACLRRVKTKWEADGRPKAPPVSKQASAAPANHGAEMILRQTELKRVEERMRVIRAGYSEHQTWDAQDNAEFKTLKARKRELLDLLGMKV